MQSFRFLLAVDPSLTCSGWALFSVADGKVRAVGKVRGDPPGNPLSERLATLQVRIDDALNTLGLSELDALICESPTTMRDPHAALKVEQVRSMFEATARGRGLCVPGRINPRSVHYEVMGLSGPQLAREIVKSAAITVAKQLFSEDLMKLGFPVSEKELKKNQDIVDALLVGRLGLARLKSAESAGFSAFQMFEEKKNKFRRRACA